jgi:hypothetical protein
MRVMESLGLMLKATGPCTLSLLLGADMLGSSTTCDTQHSMKRSRVSEATMQGQWPMSNHGLCSFHSQCADMLVTPTIKAAELHR